jgi:hypothetical protein
MTPIELATRQYRNLLPHPVSDWTHIPRSRLRSWLTTDVCTAIQPYWDNARFRELAVWSLKHLRPNCGTDARRTVDEIDAALVAHAKSLVSITRLRSVAKQLQVPRANSGEIVRSGSGDSHQSSVSHPRAFDTANSQAQILEIAERFWTDLYLPNDFFVPNGGWMRRIQPVPYVQESDFVLPLNPQLPPIGDLSVHCLTHRIRSLQTTLAEFRTVCLRAARDAGRCGRDLLEFEQAAWGRLNELIRGYTLAVVTGPTAPLREACAVAAQTYLAFNPTRDTDWLDLPKRLIEHDRCLVAAKLDHEKSSRFFDLVAAALEALPALEPNDAVAASAEEVAIAKGGLVLTADRRVFWDRRPIRFEWARSPVAWKLLWRLAKKCRAQDMARLEDVYEGHRKASAFANAILRLKVVLPTTLKNKIIAVKNERAYRLDLNPGQIVIMGKDPGRIE